MSLLQPISPTFVGRHRRQWGTFPIKLNPTHDWFSPLLLHLSLLRMHLQRARARLKQLLIIPKYALAVAALCRPVILSMISEILSNVQEPNDDLAISLIYIMLMAPHTEMYGALFYVFTNMSYSRALSSSLLYRQDIQSCTDVYYLLMHNNMHPSFQKPCLSIHTYLQYASMHKSTNIFTHRHPSMQPIMGPTTHDPRNIQFMHPIPHAHIHTFKHKQFVHL